MRMTCLFIGLLISTTGWAAEFEPLTDEEQAQLESRVARIESQVAEIRGLPFKEEIGVEHQSLDDFGKYLDAELGRQIPEEKNAIYGLVVKKLGLYRGPELTDLRTTVKQMMTSQAAAYYDPNTNKFYVLMTKMTGVMGETVFAHELYHGLQDQQFGLNEFLLDKLAELNEDEAMARQAVVEGEATLMMTMWMMQSVGGGVPDPSVLDMTIKMQAGMDSDSMRAMLNSGMMNTGEMGDMAEAAKAMDELPRFMIETLVGAYMKGLGFVYELYKEGGWDEIAKLYGDRPPASTEQILHPEKWFEDERPVKIEWPELEKEAVFEGWEVLDANTLGEIQLRIIFEEYGMKNRAKAVAEGWNGDRYAVLRKKGSEDLALLLYTSWDSEGDVMQFESAYQELLTKKYEGADVQARVIVRDTDAFVIEAPTGMDAEALDAIAGKLVVTP